MTPVTKRVLLILPVWLCLAVTASLSGLPQKLHQPLPQFILFGLVGVLLVCCATIQAFKSWLMSIPLAWLIGVHIGRFVGAWFLVLHAQGRLPYDFAVPGGWGDIFVAGFAVALILAALLGPPMPGTPYFIWNTAGLLDILFVVTTAARLALQEPASMAVLLQFPLSLLPTFLVPLIIFTHVIIGLRLMRRGSESV